MNTPGYVYQPRLPLNSLSADEVPVIRLWSKQPLVNQDWQIKTMEQDDPVHLLGLIFNASEPDELVLAKEAQTILRPQHCMKLPDSTETTLLAIRDMVYALQCDWSHSVMANAELEDLIQVLGNNAQLQVDTAVAFANSQWSSLLEATCIKAMQRHTKGIVLLRAHATQDFNKMTPLLEDFRSQLVLSSDFICLDVYDPNLERGQKRFTCLYT
jgi:hypothetical protein